MTTPLISTITPCFKMKPYLKLFLEELPNQTIFNQIEVVLDHNEPDEEELAWVKEFQDKHPGRLKHIITNPVEFIGPSMNRCIKEASADLLAIWNVDDLRTPNSLELQVQAFDAGADMVYGNFHLVRKFGTKKGTWIDFSQYQNKPDEFFRSMLFGPFMAFRKSLCTKAGMFDEQFKSGADFDLALRLAFHGKPILAQGSLGYYLNEGKGASTRPDSKQPLERTAIELRYGIYDKLDYDYVIPALSYDLNNLYEGQRVIPINTFVPDYKNYLAKAKEKLLNKGLNSYTLHRTFHIKKIKTSLKTLIKKIIV